MSFALNSRAFLPALVAAASLTLASHAFAQDAAKPAPAKAKPAAKQAHPAAHSKHAAKTTSKKTAAKNAKQPVAEVAPPAASPEQVAAAEKVYYGVSDCEFKQTLDVTMNQKYPAYVDVKFDKKQWTMKPVMSSTGALRLEDVRNQAIVIQIAQKSMLLNTVTGQRLVDECVGAQQRELALQARASAEASKDSLAIAPPAAPDNK